MGFRNYDKKLINYLQKLYKSLKNYLDLKKNNFKNINI